MEGTAWTCKQFGFVAPDALFEHIIASSSILIPSGIRGICLVEYCGKEA